MNIYEKLDIAISKNNSLLCIGLDPVYEKIPADLKKADFTDSAGWIFAFNKAIIDATHPYVMGYKPNSAFYEAYGAEGITQLKKTCEYIKKQHPELFLILDAKRADIGSTNEGYVKFAFDYLQADAITLQVYPGKEALQPFLDRTDKGSIFWCKSSNPGSDELQDVVLEGGAMFYEFIAGQIVASWNENKNCMLVVGATYPEELKRVREIAGDMPILLPGIGAQGGDLEESLKAGLTKDKKGLIVTVGRSVIYAGSGPDFAAKAAAEAKKLQESINDIRNN